MVRRRNGFTLIEIIVVLMIASIGSVVVGSMIVTSVQLNNESVKENMQKQIADEIVSYFKEQFYASTAIYVQQDQPQIKDENNNDLTWNQIYVQNHQLYRNNEEIFENDFYQRNNISVDITLKQTAAYITVRVSSSQYSEYQTTAVIDLDNIIYGTSELENAVITSENKIYYSLDKTLVATLPDQPEEPEEPGDEEETDIDFIIKGEQNYGAYSNITANSNLQAGSIIFNKDDGYWYQVVKNVYVDNIKDLFNSNADNELRILDRYYRKKNPYYKGDVVIYKANDGTEMYIECIEDCNQYTYLGTSIDSIEWKRYWKVLENGNQVKFTNPVEYDSSQETVATVYDQLEEDIKKYNPQEYDEAKWNQYQVGDMVKITYPAKYGPDHVEYYMKIYDYDAKPGETDNQGRLAWRLYSKVYSNKSAYAIGDIVGALDHYQIHYRQFLRECIKPYTSDEIKRSHGEYQTDSIREPLTKFIK